MTNHHQVAVNHALRSKVDGIPVVWGAGGVKGWAHIGVARALEQLNIKVGLETGTSVGAGFAAFRTNGFTAEQILEIFVQSHKRLVDPGLFMSSFKMPTMMQWLVSQSCWSLEGPWRETVERFGLKPNERLQILSYDVVGAHPYLFFGTDYDLAKAIAASGSVPGVFVPVEYGCGLHVDGAKAHYNSTKYSPEPAIVVRLGRVTQDPRPNMNPADFAMHWREKYLPLLPTVADVDETKNYVLDIPCPDIAGLAFFTELDRCFSLVDAARNIAYERLAPLVDAGLIPVQK